MSERAAGVLSTTFGVAVFLVLLLSAAHLMIGLWQTTVVTSIAREGANEVATAPEGTSARQAEERAIRRARGALGSLAAGVELRFESDPVDADVVLRVRAAGLHLVPPAAAGLAGDDGLDRRIVVRRERP